MDDLTGGETDRVEILRAMELARDDARAGAFLGDEVNVVRSNHDDQGGAVLALDRVGKLSSSVWTIPWDTVPGMKSA